MSGVGESFKPSRVAVAQRLLVEDDADHAEVMADAQHKPGHIRTTVGDVAGELRFCAHAAKVFSHNDLHR